jgi:hypothetical protein
MPENATWRQLWPVEEHIHKTLQNRAARLTTCQQDTDNRQFSDENGRFSTNPEANKYESMYTTNTYLPAPEQFFCT